MDILTYIFIATTVIFGIGFVVLYVMLHSSSAKIAKLSAEPQKISVPEPTVADLQAKLAAAYQAEIASSTQTFGADLKATSARLSEQVSRLTTQIIEEELGAYQSTIEELRKVAAGTMEQIRANVETQRVELRASMEAEVAKDREYLIDKFQTKMGDIVAGYITESLGGGIDLGSQMSYIVASLEAHKDDIKKDLTNGI